VIPSSLKRAAGFRLARWGLVLGVPMVAASAWLEWTQAGPLWLRYVLTLGTIAALLALFVRGYLVNPIRVSILRHDVPLIFLFRDRSAYDGLASMLDDLEVIAEAATTPTSPLPFATPRDVWTDAWAGYQVEVLKTLTDVGRPVAGGHDRGKRLIYAVTTWRGQPWQSHVRGAEALHALAYAAREKGYTGFGEPQPMRTHEPEWAAHYHELGLLP